MKGWLKGAGFRTGLESGSEGRGIGLSMMTRDAKDEGKI